MQELINSSTRPQFNLALEEYVLKNLAGEYFFIWQDEPAIIVGRNQNTAAEINEDYVKANGIHVVRRLTGGGAVYHDLGNINFTMIVDDPGGAGFDFQSFTRPIVKALANAGIAAECSGRNDITIQGKKFSGNAQYRYGSRLLHHGTLLFATDLSVLGSALRVKPQKIEAKGVKSVQSRVTNIADYAPGLSLGGFKHLVIDWLHKEYSAEADAYQLSNQEYQVVQQLADNKYSSWAWNFGQSPKYNLVRSHRFDWGEVEVFLEVRSGKIDSIKLYGDFFAADDLTQLEQALTGISYEAGAINERISQLDINRYLPQMDKGVFCKLIID
ncbi:MAG: lipoate--protein ligase [Methylocystaceae bacterium]